MLNQFGKPKHFLRFSRKTGLVTEVSIKTWRGPDLMGMKYADALNLLEERHYVYDFDEPEGKNGEIVKVYFERNVRGIPPNPEE